MDPALPSGPVTSAMVLAGGVLTRYRRCGTGPTVVVLGAPDSIRVLVKSFRVIAPELPSTDDLPDTSPKARARWLGGVFDGLGIESAVLVTSPDLAAAAARFAAAEPDRVRTVVVAGDNPDDVPAAIARAIR